MSTSPLPQNNMNGQGASRAVWLYLALAFAVYAWLSGRANFVSTDHAPSDYPDPVSYFVHAKIIAGGAAFSVPTPQPPAFFNTPYFLDDGGRFYGMYPPGWPTLLAGGMVLRVPWLVNPLLTVLGLLALYHLGRRLYDDRIAWIAMALASLWPPVSWFAAGYFSEPASFLFATLALLGLVGAGQSRPLPHALLCGASLGMLFLIRPWTALSLALPVGATALWALRKRFSLFPALCAGGVLFGLCALVHLGYNGAMTGHYLTFPLTLFNPANTIGFGFHSTNNGMQLDYYGPFEAMKRLLREMAMSNLQIMPLALPLVFVAVWRRQKPGDLLLGVCIASLIAFHIPYFFQQVRHWLPLIAAFALLIVRGVFASARLMTLFPAPLRERQLPFLILILLALATLGITVPSMKRTLRHNVDLAAPYRDATGTGLSNAIVFMASSPAYFNTPGLYSQEAPDFNASVLFGRDLPGEDNAAVLRRYPGRTPYRYWFDKKTGTSRFTRLQEAP